MQLRHETIGKFIDCCVNDQAEAESLLNAYPELRNASWIGDEHLLTFLVIENYLEGVLFCLKHGFDVNQADADMGTSLLHYACKLNYLDMATTLLKYGANPNAICQIDGSPIHCAIRNGNAELVDALLQNQANPCYRTPLGESIFDNWPRWAADELNAVMKKHCVSKHESN